MACWHLAQDEDTVEAWKQAALNPDTFESSFVTYITGFYDHSKEYLNSRGWNLRPGKMVKSSTSDATLQPVLLKAIEMTHIKTILSMSFPEPKAENASFGARKLRESGLKIGVIYTDMTMSACLLGSWHAEAIFDDAKSIIIPGGNHFVMMHRPDEFWVAVLEVS